MKIPVIQIYERYDGANKVQIEQLLMLSYSSNSSIFRAKKLETKVLRRKQRELEKLSESSPEYMYVRKQKTHG